jgi:opacity protein-like surface antigen
MQKACNILAAFLFLTLTSAAQAQWLPSQASLRYSAQISNGPAGDCECFTLQGAAADLYWNIGPAKPRLGVGIAFDAGVEHTGDVNGAGYGLTLSTFTAGPRIKLPLGKTQAFAQALFGVAHGSGSEFPQSNNTLMDSANSFALVAGAGADYPINQQLSVRFLQVDYLRTALPNNSNNWQNNLRIAAGLTFHFSH